MWIVGCGLPIFLSLIFSHFIPLAFSLLRPQAISCPFYTPFPRKLFVPLQHISTDNRLSSTDSSGLSGEDDLLDVDYTTQDWSRIQMCLRLLGATRGFGDRLSTFESKMRAALVQILENIEMAQSDAFSPARLLSGTPKGAMQILAQSTLNLMEFQDLLKLVEPDPQQQLLRVVPSPHIPHTITSQSLSVLTGARRAVSESHFRRPSSPPYTNTSHPTLHSLYGPLPNRPQVSFQVDQAR